MKPRGQGRLRDEHGFGGSAHVATAGNLEEAFHLGQEHALAIGVFYGRVNTIGRRPMAIPSGRAAPCSPRPTLAGPRPRFRWRAAPSIRLAPCGPARDLFCLPLAGLSWPQPYGNRAGVRKGSNT